MTQEVVNSIPSWRYFQLQLIVASEDRVLSSREIIVFQVSIAVATKSSSFGTSTCFLYDDVVPIEVAAVKNWVSLAKQRRPLDYRCDRSSRQSTQSALRGAFSADPGWTALKSGRRCLTQSAPSTPFRNEKELWCHQRRCHRRIILRPLTFYITSTVFNADVIELCI